jgi:hypothetical protein
MERIQRKERVPKKKQKKGKVASAVMERIQK